MVAIIQPSRQAVAMVGEEALCCSPVTASSSKRMRRTSAIHHAGSVTNVIPFAG
jgi:hypothetical protein